METIYRVDSRRRTYGELWRQAATTKGFLTAALGKLMGIQQPCKFGVRRPKRLEIHEYVPDTVEARLAPTISTCDDLNLPFQFYASIDAMIGGTTKAYLVAMLHTDYSTWATAMTALVKGKATPTKFNCFSLLQDGRYVVTSDHKWKLVKHPQDIVVQIPDASPVEVERRHNERMAEWRAEIVRPEQLQQAILTREQRHVDYQIERGVYVPMTTEEIERIVRRPA